MTDADPPGGAPRLIEGAANSEWPSDGLIIRLEVPCHRMRRGDRLVVRGPSGDEIDVSLASERADGLPSVWYAINPTLRHWLGWLEPVDDSNWRLRMEPFHLALLDDLRVAAEQPDEDA